MPSHGWRQGSVCLDAFPSFVFEVEHVEVVGKAVVAADPSKHDQARRWGSAEDGAVAATGKGQDACERLERPLPFYKQSQNTKIAALELSA